jgi:hypothetical protein
MTVSLDGQADRIPPDIVDRTARSCACGPIDFSLPQHDNTYITAMRSRPRGKSALRIKAPITARIANCDDFISLLAG